MSGILSRRKGNLDADPRARQPTTPTDSPPESCRPAECWPPRGTTDRPPMALPSSRATGASRERAATLAAGDAASSTAHPARMRSTRHGAGKSTRWGRFRHAWHGKPADVNRSRTHQAGRRDTRPARADTSADMSGRFCGHYAEIFAQDFARPLLIL